MDTRAEFEAWAEREQFVITKRDGDYTSETTFFMWEAWQASRSQAEARVAAMEKDAERLDEIASEYLTLEPFSMPTPGGDDADVGWRVTQEHEGKLNRIEVAVIYRDDPREAIDAAIAALAE